MAQRRALKLRLTARNEGALRHGALLIGEALERAALAEDVARLYLVRRFSVGPVKLAAGTVPVVGEIERRFATLRARALHVEAPGAADADVVWFWQGEAPIALARALARGPAPSAWFWPLALPSYTAALSRAAALQVALQAASSSRAGPAALAALVDAAGALAEGALFSLITIEQGRWLLDALGAHAPSEPPAGHDAAREMAPLDALAMPEQLRPVVIRWTRHWGGSDPRARWLAAMALLVSTPSLAADLTRLHRLAVQVVQHLNVDTHGPQRAPCSPETPSLTPVRSESEAPLDPGIGDPNLDSPLPSFRERATEPAPVQSEGGLGDVGAPSPDRAWESAAGMRELPRGFERATTGTEGERYRHAPDFLRANAEREEASLLPRVNALPTADHANASPFLGPALETSAGGLLFLIWALRSLGIEPWFEAHPQLVGAGFGAHLLLFIAGRLGVPGTDPLLSALRPLASGSLPDAVHWSVPAVWADAPPWCPSRAQLEACGQPCSPSALGALWGTACRRYCRIAARIGLRNMVFRRGLVACSATHLDVAFPLHAADPRVRMAGLDVDPGWVPWLGRVVLFHYLEAGRDAL